jgi:hypothetical protein
MQKLIRYQMGTSLYNAIFAIITIAMFCTVYTLFSIKYDVRQKNKKLQKIEAMISEESQNIKLLKVDFEYLSRAQNIRRLVFITPNLETVKTNQIIIIQE